MNQVARSSLLVFLAAASQVLMADPAQDPPSLDQLPPPKPASECKVRPVKVLNPDDFYPRSAGHTGRVIVEFVVMTSPGKPANLRVDTSSSNPQMDAAALQLVSATTFKTLCPGERAKIAIKFGSP